MHILKNLIRRTPLYPFLQSRRSARNFTFPEWTDHDQEMLNFYAQFIGPNKMFYDVGANIGNRTNVFLRLNIKVISVEPQKSCIQALEQRFKKSKDLTILPSAVGAAISEAEINVSDANVLSSMNPDWIQAVSQSGRFGDQQWECSYKVPVTTLDKMIDTYGAPDFIKIDVEGYEEQVISGLSKPVHALSLEFTPEFLSPVLYCIKHLKNLGDYEMNYSLGESMKFEQPNWLTLDNGRHELAKYRGDNQLFGDIYFRLKQ